MKFFPSTWIMGCAIIALAGCAPARSDVGMADVQQWTRSRIGAAVELRSQPGQDERVDAAVSELLLHPLTADSAAQIALLNNRSLQATLEELSISQADLVQAGLLRNPVFAASFRLPDRPPNGTDTELSVEQDFLDLLVMPLRKKVAAAEFEHTKLLVADHVVQLAQDVKAAVYILQAQQQLVRRLLISADANQTAAELSQRQVDAGTANELALANQQVMAAQARLDVSMAQQQADSEREQLNRLMGLRSSQNSWSVADELPVLPGSETETSTLQVLALRQRLDLLAARNELDSMEQAVRISRGFRYFADVSFGVDTERTPDGQRVTGPTLSLQMPVFDQGQARVSRDEAHLRTAQDRYMALAIDAASEVREASQRMLVLRSAVSSTNAVLHQRRHIVDLTLEHYNGMLMGTYDLLLARQNETAANRAYVEALRDYWLARVQLERAVGGRLATAIQPPTTGDSK